MLAAIILPLLVVTGNSAPMVVPQQSDPPVKVWLSDDSFERGDRAKVYVKADRDGYVVVLHAEPDGRVRVLFPLDPTDDDYIKAGETYEVRGRGDRNAFTVYDSRGEGVVFAAYSPDPFKFDSFVRSDHWDYRADGFRVGEDTEADLTELARQMAGQAEFQYDLVRYDVEQHVAYGGSSSWDYPYYPYYSGWYDPWYYRPWRSGIYFGVSFGSPWYSSCWYCDPWDYDPWYPSYYYSRAWYRSYYYNYYGGYGWGGYSPYRYGGRPSVIYTAFGNRYGTGYGGQRYGFNFVQPGRRTLGLYNPGPSPVELRRRVVIPPTDIVAPDNNTPRVREQVQPGVGTSSQNPSRRVEPNTGPAKPRAADQPRRVEPSRRPDTQPRGLVPIRDVREPSNQGTERPRSIREVPPTEREPVVREPSRQTRPETYERPHLERRSPERSSPPPEARPSEPRVREPRASPSRPSSPPPRVSSPPRSGGGGYSSPRSAPRGGSGGGGGRSQPSSGRRRG